jgi:hypothetical protein
MRFVLDGPDIPNELIKEWREGKVLFLAGAGVSVPSKLPLFEGLVLGVYKELNAQLFSILQKARSKRSKAAQKKLIDAADLQPESRVEAGLFLDKQYDRLFSSLEKRYDPDTKGRAKTRRVRDAAEKILGSGKYSATHQDLLRLSVAPNPAEDNSKPSVCRLVTTNFDLMFEAAWPYEIGGRSIAFDARMAPRPGAHNFAGIIHLHGAIDPGGNNQSNYILSSRDFARVYLRSGVIGNYIYDLIRRYRLVLIGYSADDPPMRYLMDAIGEDASLFDDMRQPYAITDIGTGSDEAVEQAVWYAKEITAKFFLRRAGKRPYAPLWESIAKWAEWARDESTWVEQELGTLTKTRYRDASPFQQAYVQDLLSVLTTDELAAAISFLAAKKVDFAWIGAVSAAIEASKAPSKAP